MSVTLIENVSNTDKPKQVDAESNDPSSYYFLHVMTGVLLSNGTLVPLIPPDLVGPSKARGCSQCYQDGKMAVCT